MVRPGIAAYNAQWGDILTQLNPNAVSVSVPYVPEGLPYGADVTARSDTGPIVLSELHSHKADCMIDIGGAGLTFIEGPGGFTQLKLTHEVAGVPMSSYFVDPVSTVLGHLAWPAVWQILASASWTKIVWDADHGRELVRFGVQRVGYLPACALTVDPTPRHLAEPTIDVQFVGDATVNADRPGAVDTAARANAVAAAAARMDSPDRSFFDIYHQVYSFAAPPTEADSPTEQLEKSTRFFHTKHLYTLELARLQRDRFVILLAQRLGRRFRILGRGWQKAYGIPSQPLPPAREDRVRTFCDARIHIALVEPNTDSALHPTHFEIAAAGGFLLCHNRLNTSKCFSIGQSCGTFSDEGDLMAKIQHHLGHAHTRRHMAARGRHSVESEHLAKHRLRALVESNALRATPRSAVEQACDHPDPIPPTVARNPGPGLLFLLNPGRFTRHYLLDMMAAARRAGVQTDAIELGEVWSLRERGAPIDEHALERRLREHRICAAIGSGMNGLTEWACVPGADGRPRPLLERLGIPHLMWWTDHPQWANNKMGLRPDLQPLLKSPNNRHFLKSAVAAEEVGEMLGWPNCHGLPVAEDPGSLTASKQEPPDFDIAAVVGSPPKLPPSLEPFLAEDDPDVGRIRRMLAAPIQCRLRDLWRERAPAGVAALLEPLSREWVQSRRREPLTASFHCFRRTAGGHPEAAEWLRHNPQVYFDAVECLWEFSRWERTFTLRYLAKYFRVGVFGADWSGVGLGHTGWIPHHEQPAAYGRGRMAINVSQANDEEGVAHKPFQIAASGVPMLHINRKGLEACFEPGKEVACFDTPAQARAIVQQLLADPMRREQLAMAAWNRLCQDHTWDRRLPEMLSLAGIRLDKMQAVNPTGGEGHPACVATR